MGAGTKAFFERYARLYGHARAVLAAASAIPIEIPPKYPERA